MKFRQFFLKFLLGIIIYLFGVISLRYNLFPINVFREISQKKEYHIRNLNKEPPKNDSSITIKNFNNEDFTVIFAFGQSNAANYGQVKYTCSEEVYNWLNNEFYKAKDPLKGADGSGGSVWTRVADKLIQRGKSKKIILISIGVGKTKVSDWGEKGKYYKRLKNALKSLREEKIELDYIMWHQGEVDNLANTTQEDYINEFKSIRSVFRERAIKAPIFVSIASYDPNQNALLNEPFGCDTNIRNAQIKLVNNFTDVFAGPDTDKLNLSYQRYDGVHFSNIGMDMFANMWIEAIEQYEKGEILSAKHEQNSVLEKDTAERAI